MLRQWLHFHFYLKFSSINANIDILIKVAFPLHNSSRYNIYCNRTEMEKINSTKSNPIKMSEMVSQGKM